MKIKYKFADGTTSEIEVSEEIGTVILDSRREEDNLIHKEKYHCYSSDAVEFEGEAFGTNDYYGCFDNTLEENAHIENTINKLSEVQKRRLLMFASGMTMREIARREGVDHKAISKSIEGAKNKFIKYF